jgi:hypothetical protein
MINAGLIIGLFFIGMGFSIKRYPDLIPWYSIISKDKKKNIDFDGLVTFTKKGFILIGTILITLSFILKIAHLEAFVIVSVIPVTLFGLIIIIAKGQKYDYNIKKNNV